MVGRASCKSNLNNLSSTVLRHSSPHLDLVLPEQNENWEGGAIICRNVNPPTRFRFLMLGKGDLPSATLTQMEDLLSVSSHPPRSRLSRPGHANNKDVDSTNPKIGEHHLADFKQATRSQQWHSFGIVWTGWLPIRSFPHAESIDVRPPKWLAVY